VDGTGLKVAIGEQAIQGHLRLELHPCMSPGGRVRW